MLSKTLRLKFCYLKIIHILYLPSHLKTVGHILKNKQNNKCGCFHEIVRSVLIKMEMKMKNKSHISNVNRPRPRHGCKYSKHKKCLRMMMLICLKQHLSNIWSSIPEKIKQPSGWVQKSVAYKKGCIFNNKIKLNK